MTTCMVTYPLSRSPADRTQTLTHLPHAEKGAADSSFLQLSTPIAESYSNSSPLSPMHAGQLLPWPITSVRLQEAWHQPPIPPHAPNSPWHVYKNQPFLACAQEAMTKFQPSHCPCTAGQSRLSACTYVKPTVSRPNLLHEILLALKATICSSWPRLSFVQDS